MSCHNKLLNTLASAVVVSLCTVGRSASAAPDNVAALEQRTLTIGDAERTYHLYVPKNLSPDKAAPLVLAFHGRGREGNGRDFARKTQFSALARNEGFLVAYPDGVEGKWLDGGLMDDPRFAGDVEFAGAIMDDAAKRHPVDPRRIYATGFSNGAAFSYLVAIRLSHRVAAIASVGANMSRAFLKGMTPDKDPVSLLQFCGSLDPFCGREPLRFDYLISLKENVDAWVRHDGCEAASQLRPLGASGNRDGLPPAKVWANGRDGTEVALVWLDGAAHGWPIPMAGGGSTDVTPLIWQFFKAHPKAALDDTDDAFRASRGAPSAGAVDGGTRRPMGIGFGLGRGTGELAAAMTNENDFVDTMARAAGLAEMKRLSERGVKVSSVFLSLGQMRETISTLKANGLRCDYLAYNPEQTPRIPRAELDDFVGSVRQAKELAAAYGAPLVVGPGMLFMTDREDDYARAAPHADVWLIQSQRFQIDKETGRRAMRDEFSRNVCRIAELVHRGNPKTKIWVQIIVCPGARPENEFTAAEITALAQSLEGVADAVRLYTAGATRGLETLKEVIGLLRSNPAPMKENPSP
jgi:polyhydroxybutyrate depolymerase